MFPLFFLVAIFVAYYLDFKELEKAEKDKSVKTLLIVFVVAAILFIIFRKMNWFAHVSLIGIFHFVVYAFKLKTKKPTEQSKEIKKDIASAALLSIAYIGIGIYILMKVLPMPK
jgi:uncharacterized protein YqhQ